MERKLTDKKIMDMFAEIKELFRESEKRRTEMEIWLAKILGESELRGRKMEERLEKIGINLGGIGNTTGRMAEDLFYNSLSEENLRIGKLVFQEIEKNLKTPKKKGEKITTTDEFDLILSAKDAMAIIEVKYRVRPADIKNILTKKLSHFSKHYPEKLRNKVYLGIAGMSFEGDAEADALIAGLIILKIKAGVFLDKTREVTDFSTPKQRRTKRPAKKK